MSFDVKISIFICTVMAFLTGLFVGAAFVVS